MIPSSPYVKFAKGGYLFRWPGLEQTEMVGILVDQLKTLAMYEYGAAVTFIATDHGPVRDPVDGILELLGAELCDALDVFVLTPPASFNAFCSS
jgi:hypothetical protein